MITLRSWTAEFVTAIVLLAAIVALFVQTAGFAPSPVRGYPGAAFFPRLALFGTAIFVVLWLGLLLAKRKRFALADGEEARFDFEMRDYLVTIGATLAFIYGMDLVGFEISCFLFLAALLYPRVEKVVTAILVSAVTTLVLYATFVLLLNVSMPLLFLPRFLSF